MSLRRVAFALLLALVPGLARTEDVAVKTRPTLVTPSVAEAYRNDASMKALALQGDARPFCALVGHAPAERWVEKADDWFWDVMPSTTIRRVVTVGNDSFRNPKLGCPVHGAAIYSVEAYYPWVVDCEALPYKLTCPIGGETYPSNDFAAGDMTGGAFADGGSGCVVDGARYHFVGLYAHYAYNTVIQPAIKSFGRAYTITGDPRYAHKAAVCLLKDAYEYPNATDRRQRTYIPGYEFESGMISDVVWSSAALVNSATCYDEIAAALEGDAALVAFAHARIPEIMNVNDLRAYIEERLLRPGMKAIVDRRVQPNAGWASEAMATLALVMNDFGERHPNAADALEWLYYGAGNLKTVGNQFLKDGSSYESTSYNAARKGFMRAGELVAQLREASPGKVDDKRFPDIRRNEKLQRYFDTYSPGITSLGGAWTIAVGDVGTPVSIERTPRLTGPASPSQFLDGYGLAVLRSGEGAAQRDISLFYGGLRGHAHYDPLMLGMHGFGRDLLPNIGYPESWNFASAWEWSLLTHNTVAVNRDEHPCSTVIGSLTLWAPMEGCQVVEASKRPYRRNEPRGRNAPDVTDYRRFVALIDISPSAWYAVDVFRVTGGRDHLQSWHGAFTPHPAKVEGVEWVPQTAGTLAGAGVEYGQRYLDADGKERWDPYCFLRDVASGSIKDQAAMDWPYDTDEEVHVRLTFPTDGPTELITARGGAPIAPDKNVLQWAFPHRSGAEGFHSQFVTVIEAYSRERTLGVIRRLRVKSSNGRYEPVAFEIAVPGGRDVLLANADESTTLEGEGFRLVGKFGLVRERSGAVSYMYLAGGAELVFGDARLTLPPLPPARILEVDRAEGAIVVSGGLPAPEQLAGRRILVDNHGERLSRYTIVDAKAAGPDLVRLKLDSSGVLGEGVAYGFEDGAIRNGPEINMPFAGLCEFNGELDYSDCFHFGGHLETGKPGVCYKVRGVMGFPYQAWGLLHEAGRNHVHLCESVPAAELEAAIGVGTQWTIYEYGPGDELRFDSYGRWPMP